MTETRTCRICQRDFEAHHWHAKICGSDECHRERDRRAAWHRRNGPGTVPSPTKGWRRWTAQQDDLLRWNWGQVSRERLEEMLGHTWAAINWRAVRLGLGSLARGAMMLKDLERITGYDKRSIKRFARHLGIKLHKIRSCRPRGTRVHPRRYAIETEEADRLIEWLRSHPGNPYDDVRGWGQYGRFSECVCCGRSDRPHNGRGLCEACYANARRHGELGKHRTLASKLRAAA